MASNGHGGSRKGAGRPVGTGRSGGSNKVTASAVAYHERNAMERKRQQIIKDGNSPIDFLLDVMLDEGNDMRLRVDAAKSVAPYVAPRLQAIDVKVDDGRPVDITSIPTSVLLESLGVPVINGKAERLETANGVAKH